MPQPPMMPQPQMIPLPQVVPQRPMMPEGQYPLPNLNARYNNSHISLGEESDFTVTLGSSPERPEQNGVGFNESQSFADNMEHAEQMTYDEQMPTAQVPNNMVPGYYSVEEQVSLFLPGDYSSNAI
ncbi:hypothetical protein QQX98_004748 [Neonectria punicea]|uniref:Uncharacterized protein n=1 Tax=Neonectria punicea TaxID=979145 RepID=A0ABR1H7Q0_9HYPO